MLDDTVGGGRAPSDKAEYIERMARELSRLAAVSGLPFLSYLLDMAAEEATQSRPDGRLVVGARPPLAADLDRNGTSHPK